MTVISVTITESEEQIVSGFPKSVTVSTNIMSNIYYTLDGTDPDTYSDMYDGLISIPVDKPTLILKIFASNGTDMSPIIETIYRTTSLTDSNVRAPHSGTDATVQASIKNDPRPFGSQPIQPEGNFTPSSDVGNTTYNPLLPSTSNGFDADGNPNAFTNSPFLGIASKDLPVLLTETNWLGETGPGIGNLPKSKVQNPVPPKQQTNIADKLYDPRALVIFQDYSDPQNVPEHADINRMYFTLENPNVTRDGNQFYNSGLDSPGPTGSFLRQHFNPKDNTITYYYRDSSVNRWIISKTGYTPAPGMYDYSNVFSSRKGKPGWVFSWRTYGQRFLY
jgi:hypothetical protein